MKTLQIYGLIATALFITSCGGKADESETQSELPKYVHIPPQLPDSIITQLRSGDIIIRKGNGPLSYHLMNNTKEDYSHCGVIVKEGDHYKVIHTLGGSASDDQVDGVQMQDLSDFVWNAADSMLYICRPVFMDSAGSKIADRAYYYLGEHIPFDHRFSVFTTDQFYCTELLFYIFRDIGARGIFEIKKKHKSYMLMFSTFFNEKNFKPIFHLREDNRKKRSNKSVDTVDAEIN